MASRNQSFCTERHDPSLGTPEWLTRWFLVAAGIGFPFWIALAWFYEFTPEGLKRESEIDRGDPISHRTSRRLDFAIIGVLSIAVVLLLTDRFMSRHRRERLEAVLAEEGAHEKGDRGVVVDDEDEGFC